MLYDNYIEELNENGGNIQNEIDNLLSLITSISCKINNESGNVNEYLFKVYKIGEEPKKEETIVEEPIKEEPIQQEQKEEKFNIWIIIAGIELLLIIILVVLLKKNRSKDNKLDNNKQFVQ